MAEWRIYVSGNWPPLGGELTLDKPLLNDGHQSFKDVFLGRESPAEQTADDAVGDQCWAPLQ
jgi:hypothetical protein